MVFYAILQFLLFWTTAPLDDWSVTRHILSQSKKDLRARLFPRVISAEWNCFASWLAHLLRVGQRNFYSFSPSTESGICDKYDRLEEFLEHCNLCVCVYCENSSSLFVTLTISLRIHQMSMNAPQAKPSVTEDRRASTPQALSIVFARLVTQEMAQTAVVRPRINC